MKVLSTVEIKAISGGMDPIKVFGFCVFSTMYVLTGYVLLNENFTRRATKEEEEYYFLMSILGHPYLPLAIN